MGFSIAVSEDASARLPAPLGYSANAHSATSIKSSRETSAASREDMKRKKAWSLVMTGVQQLPMQLFMMWMSGNSIQIFSIMFLGMTFYNSLKNVVNVNQTFTSAIGHVGSDNLVMRLAYVAAQLLSFCVGFYKASSLGLLPTTTSDWLFFLPDKIVQEHVYGTAVI